MAGLKITTPPATQPVSLDDVKTQLQVELADTLYDDQIEALIPAATDWCQDYQNRAYITQTIELALDYWPCGCDISLPRPPLQSITSFVYTDSDDNSTTWPASNYVMDNYSFIGRLVKAKNVRWPSVSLTAANGIKIQYVAGYGDDPEDVPAVIRQAIILLCIHWFNNGLCDPPNAVYALLNLHRVVNV